MTPITMITGTNGNSPADSAAPVGTGVNWVIAVAGGGVVAVVIGQEVTTDVGTVVVFPAVWLEVPLLVEVGVGADVAALKNPPPPPPPPPLPPPEAT
jgi:hypothetical protein